LGAHLEFRLAPGGEAVSFLPVKSVFYVVLKGHAETAARQLLIWNLHKNWSSTLVGPQRVGDELVWGPIQLKRDCDPVREGMAAVIVADAGDMLVAAVDLTGAVAPTPKGAGEMPLGRAPPPVSCFQRPCPACSSSWTQRARRSWSWAVGPIPCTWRPPIWT